MISIIGVGKVGSAIAFMCGASGISDLVLVNRDEKKAIGEALDISPAIPAGSPISILGTSDCSKIAGSDIVVIAASVGTHLQKRTDMMREQASMMNDIALSVSEHAPNAKVLMVTNPVDVLTYVIQNKASLSPKNVIGVASGLDSGRFRYVLSKELGTSQSNISGAMVMGEHDDTMVPIFSAAKYHTRPATEFLDKDQMQRISADVRNYWRLLRNYKGQSVFGIAKVTFDIIDAITHDRQLDTVASVLLGGEYGFSDVCMGVPITVGKAGVVAIRQVDISDDEYALLAESATKVKDNIRMLYG